MVDPLSKNRPILNGRLNDLAVVVSRLGGRVSAAEGSDLTQDGRLTALETAAARDDLTGWGFYAHTGSPQVIAADSKTTLLNNAATKIESQKPFDVNSFYDGSVITGRVGDGVAVGVEFIFTPTSGLASYLDIAIDIGGSIGEIYPDSHEITRGSGVPHGISYNINAYTLDTWQANGGSVMIVSDGPGTISEVNYVIHRLHRAVS